MKKFFVCSMMCLATLCTEAQVLTSATVSKNYHDAVVENESEFAYNAEQDANGDITTLFVFKKSYDRKGNITLRPTFRYQYEYAADGRLLSRTTSVWRGDDWHRAGRLDYSLAAGVYSVEYSRWNRKMSVYDAPVDKMTYTLLPDDSVGTVACYHRNRKNAPLTQQWQVTVSGLPLYMASNREQK